jgi:hypothetical protein
VPIKKLEKLKKKRSNKELIKKEELKELAYN